MCISFRLSNIGVVAIKSHEKTVKHAKNLNSFNLQPSVSQFFSKPASSPGSSVVESVTAAGLVQPKNFFSFAERDNITLTEIIVWALDICNKDISHHTCSKVGQIFHTMFMDFMKFFIQKLHII